MELKGTFNDWRMKPGNVNDPNSYRTRKGKVETACRQACMKKRIFFLVLPLGKTTDQDST